MKRLPSVSLLVLLAACGTSGGGTSAVTDESAYVQHPHSQAGQSWTVLGYWIGDNNIDPWVEYNLAQMANVGSGGTFTILLQVKRDPSQGNGGPVLNVPAWTGVKRFQVEKGSLTELPTLDTNANMDNPDTLADFIAWGAAKAPADHYAFFMWDHGGGWDGIGSDDLSHDWMSIPRLRTGLKKGLALAGKDQFAVLGLDACFMASFEDVATLRSVGEYFVGSQPEESGWDYNKLSLVKNAPATMPLDLAKAMVDGYAGLYPGQTDGIAMSVVDLANLEPLVTEVGSLAQALQGTTATQLAPVRRKTLSFNEGDPSTFQDEVDLVSFANTLAASNPTYSAHASAIQQAVDSAVVYKFIGAGHQGAHGISIAMPTRARWSWERPIYADLASKVPEVKSWFEFVKGVVEGPLVGAAPVFVDANHVATLDANRSTTWLTASGTLSAESAAGIVNVTLYVGTPDASGIPHYFADVRGAMDSQTKTASASYSGIRLQLGQANATASAYRSITYGADGSEVDSIPIYYRPTPSAPGQRATLRISWNAKGNEIGRSWVLAAGTTGGAVTRQVLPKGSTIQAMRMIQNTTGSYVFQAFGPVIDPNSPYDLLWSNFATGDVISVELDATNDQGSYDAETGQVTW